MWTNTAASSPHLCTEQCWQFPQMKLCHSETWSMALIFQILTSVRPWGNLFLSTTTKKHTSAVFSPQFYPFCRTFRYFINIKSKVFPAHWNLVFKCPVLHHSRTSGQCLIQLPNMKPSSCATSQGSAQDVLKQIKQNILKNRHLTFGICKYDMRKNIVIIYIYN